MGQNVSTLLKNSLVSPNSQLLALPPEIRSIIYRYTLIRDGNINMQPRASTAPDQPSLLQVNRQIRAEATGIYYLENRFVWTISNFDGTMFLKWQKSSKARANARIGLRYNGTPVWTNLLVWLEEFANRKVQGIGAFVGHYPAWVKAAGRMFDVVKKLGCQKHTWDEIKLTLENMRMAVGQYDDRWLKDG